MGFFSNGPKGISKYTWEKEVRPKLYNELELDQKTYSMIEAMFYPYLYGRIDVDRGISTKEIENQIKWLRDNYRKLPCTPFSKEDIDILEEILKEFSE